MAKAPESVQDAVMDATKMKSFLKLAASGDDESGGKPVRLPIVVGLDKAGEAVVSVAKKGQPKKLRKELIATVMSEKLTSKIDADNSHLYFGYAYTRPDAPGVLQIDVNKKPAGEGKLATQVFKRVRTAGFGQVVFNVNEALEAEPEDDAAGAAAPPPPPPGAPPQAAAAPNVADLQKLLATLIPRIGPAAGEDAGLRARLMKFATDANVNLKTNNPTYAAAAIGQLKTALDAAGTGAAAAPAAAAAAGAGAYAKSRLAWLAARKKVAGDIEKLRAEIVATYQADGVAADLDKRYGERVTPLLTTLDESLADKLDEATNAADPAARSKLVGEARAIITQYQGFIAGEPIIADLDANPFVPLAIAQTLTATLTGLSAALR